MSKTPELSIIVPVYNVEAYIEVCLNSISEQTFTDWECILIDDGSKDWSGFICDNYSKRDDRFKVVHQKNAGVSAARNVGIELATAPYISFIDPDDYISLNYFELLMQAIKASRSNVALASEVNINERGLQREYRIFNIINGLFSIENGTILNTQDEIIDYITKGTTSLNSWGKVYNRELWKSSRFPVNIDLGEELNTIPNILIKSERAIIENRALYYYRIREKSLLHGTVSEQRLKRTMEQSNIAYANLTALYPEHKRKFAQLKVSNDLCCLLNYETSENSNRPRGSLLSTLSENDNGFLAAVLDGFAKGGGKQ